MGRMVAAGECAQQEPGRPLRALETVRPEGDRAGRDAGQGPAGLPGGPEGPGEGAGAHEGGARRRRPGRAASLEVGADPRQGGGAGMPPLLRQGLQRLRQGTREEPLQEHREQQVRGPRTDAVARHAGPGGMGGGHRRGSCQGRRRARERWRAVRGRDAPLRPVAGRRRATCRGARPRPRRQGALRTAP